MVLLGGVFSTEERIRVRGGWHSSDSTGLSPTGDQTAGSANFTFNKPGGSVSNEILYHPRVYLRTSNYTFASDSFGRINERLNGTPFDLAAGSHGYELCIKYGTSLDDVALMVIPNDSMRAALIKRYHEMGIDKINGVPIEDIIVSDSHRSEAVQKMQKRLKAEGAAMT